MTPVKKPLSKNQKYEKKQRDKGLDKITGWVPAQASDEFKEMMVIITEFYLEKGGFHRDLIPAMYRNIKNGQNGNKSLYDIKKKAAKV